MFDLPFEKLGGRTRLCRGRAAKQNEGRGEIKQSSCFPLACPAARPIFQSKPICPRRPGSLREVIKRLAACQLHGESHPSRGSHATAPIACDGSRQEPLQRSDVRLDGSIIVPAAGRGRTGSHPVLAACCFSLPARKYKPKTYFSFSVESRCFLPADHRAAAAWALAFAKAAGMCLMIGYSVFKVPGEAKKNLSLYLPLSERSAQHYSKSFLSFFRTLIFRTWTALR